MTEDQNFRLALLQMAIEVSADAEEAIQTAILFHAYVMRGAVLHDDEESKMERVQ